jgi:hypothetical protein
MTDFVVWRLVKLTRNPGLGGIKWPVMGLKCFTNPFCEYNLMPDTFVLCVPKESMASIILRVFGEAVESKRFILD